MKAEAQRRAAVIDMVDCFEAAGMNRTAAINAVHASKKVSPQTIWNWLKLVNGVPPSSTLMIVFGAIALAANLTCLALLWRFRRLNVNMSSTFECSRNDVASNIGVLVAGGLVALTATPWPDIAAGTIIAAIFLRSAWHVLAEAIPAWAMPIADKRNADGQGI